MNTSKVAGKSKRRGPGRPKGSRNSKLPMTRVRPEGCPSCGCTKRIVVRVIGTHVVHMTDASGTYNQLEKRTVRCDHCGKHRVEGAYHFVVQ